MSVSGIHGQLLEVTVVSCSRLKDTEWISRQDPYVCLDYASTKHRTPTCTDGGKNPTFQTKFVFTLIEGLREMNVAVWNSNTVNRDDFIGSGKIQLLKVLSQGFDDSTWSLQTKTGRHGGEVRVIMHYANAHKPASSHAASAPPYMGAPPPHVSSYSAPPPTGHYPPPAGHYPSPAGHYPPPSGYPAPHAYSPYPANTAAYPSPYHSQPPPAYPAPYGAPSAYPPAQHNPSPFPPGPFPGMYPPPPY